ncbi:hypothetical protein ACTACN_00825 [Pseudomonas syringae]|uniref:hypothetical protein n=1 Tax=Pseudomonas syringae TaxID=317 RepID=UPI003F827F50
MSFTDVRLKVLKHELGHWLMARHVGFKTGNIEITMHKKEGLRGSSFYIQEGSSRVYPDPVVKNTNDLKEYLQKRFQILYAGTFAQVHGKNMTDEEIDHELEVDGASDLRVIRELAPILRGMLYGPEKGDEAFEIQFQEMMAPIRQKTRILITELFPTIDWIARRLAPFVVKHGIRYPFTPIHITDAETQFLVMKEAP